MQKRSSNLPKKHKGVIRTLARSVRQYKVYAILNPFFMAFETLCECLIPFVIGQLINFIQDVPPTGILAKIVQVMGGNPNGVGEERDFVVLIVLGSVLLVLALLSLTFGFLGGKFAAIASTGFAANLRQDIFYKIQEFSFANIDKFSTSSLVTRMTTDVNNVQMSFQMLIRIVIRVPLMMIFSVVMAFSVNATLSWIFVALLPVLGFVLIFISLKAYKVFNKLFTKYDDLNASVQENVKGIRVVKSYVREDYEKDKFAKASGNLMTGFIKAEKLVAWATPAMNMTIHISNILIGTLGALAVYYTAVEDYRFGVLAVGDMSSLITYGIQILSSLMMLSMVMVMLVMSITSANRIYEVLVEKSTIVNPVKPIYELNDGAIDFDDVSFKYSLSAEKFALADVNLHIKSGMTVGIIGSTGSSKSTLVNLISRLYDTTEGEVRVGGVNVRDYDLKTLRDNVAVVLQKNVLFSGTIKDNLRWGKEDATDEEMINACKIAHADEFIQTFPDKYDTYIEQGGTNVSGGQKQRLCIARALLKNPRIIIFDDSTSAVDTRTDAQIRKSLKDDLPNVTKIIISQRVSSVEDADMIIVMDNGRINGLGTNDELLATNAIYQEIHTIQNNIGGKPNA